MMRILFWAENFLPSIGGVEVFGLHLMKALVEKGCRFDVVCNAPPGLDLPQEELLFDNVRIHRFPFLECLSQRNIPGIKSHQNRIAHLKRTIRPDLVHLNSTLPSVFFHIRTEADHPAPVLLTLHIPGMEKIGTQGLLGDVIRSADRISAVSTAVFRTVCTMLPQVQDRTTVIHNAVPWPAIEPAELPWDPPRLLCLGRLTKQKGFDVALQAFSLLAPVHPDLSLVIAGEGEEKANLIRLAEDLALSHRVEFPGWVPPDSVHRVMNSTTVLLMPSRYEPFGLVALEAAQMARPLVASDVGGLKEIVRDNETGLLVPPNSPSLLSQAILHLLNNPQQAVAMGKKGRQCVREHFDFDVFVDAYHELYRATAASGRAPKSGAQHSQEYP